MLLEDLAGELGAALRILEGHLTPGRQPVADRRRTHEQAFEESYRDIGFWSRRIERSLWQARWASESRRALKGFDLRVRSVLDTIEEALRFVPQPLQSTLITHRGASLSPLVGIGIEFDEAGGQVCRDGDPVGPLSPLEFKLLAYLYHRAGEVCTYAMIFEEIYGDRSSETQSDLRDALSRLVARLRRRIEPDPRRPRYILSVRDVGYRLDTGERYP